MKRGKMFDKKWSAMTAEERDWFIEQFRDRNDFGDVHVKGHSEAMDDVIEGLIPFGLEMVERGGDLHLLAVPEYSGPIPKNPTKEMRDRVQAALLPVILPDVTRCRVWPREEEP